MDIHFRPADPADYDALIRVVDDWWGRPVRAILPRLFLDHFHRTSTIAERGDAPVGFLVGFLSPSDPDAAYIHAIGVAPECRGTGLARTLYQRFFEQARATGRSTVAAITSPVNEGSIAFHRALGFEVTERAGYHGPDEDRILFRRRLDR